MIAKELDLGINDPLAMSNEDVASLTRPEREQRVRDLIEQARDIVALGVEKHVTHEGRMVAAVGILYSGGNDSTILAHLFRRDADLAILANTTIGIEETRKFVRNSCEEWGLALIEQTPPRLVDQYRHLVLTDERGKKGQALGGFPGPAMHFKVMARLKGRVFESVQSELVSNPYKERVVFLAGRRRTESKRRANIPDCERRGSAVYVSPLVNWTKLDLNTYRLMMAREGDPVPTNQAADLVHMSGECLCGCNATRGEREEVSLWFPAPFEQIAELEAALADRDDIPEHRKRWGWGADPVAKAAEKEYQAQFKDAAEEEEADLPNLCSSCDDRFQAALDFGGAA
ncbi:MAG: phosphoadenosine phosphosulfate reductase domain-containing protein [Mycobacteriaceae bacterium]